ncbi:MAG TPA: sigma-70 family RNA polymerase sigma factor [Pyrinomonadaceae bacterium]|jgi:RNA polymerase sigma factor (sigma-70 family)
MLKLHLITPTHEEAFLQRYERLLAWALQLTNNDPAQAEDLLHDAFIQFTITQPDLNGIHNLDGYLYGTLRNLHLSQVRKATRGRLQQLSVVEYESAETGLRSVDPRDLIQIQDELRRVCRYVCARKETARAASVLLLRFFHGYYPGEIAQILLTTPQAVKVRLRIARCEAKACLEDPKSLVFFGSDLVPEAVPTGFARTHEDFLSELRETIFRSRSGECFSTRHIENIYLSTEGKPIDTKDLAHVVTCLVCLDTVNQVLGLPPLSERYPTDSAGKAPRSKKGPGGGAPGGGMTGEGAAVRRLRRKAREVLEHDPQELCVAVNGYIQGSQRVNSELNEQTLDLDLSEPINFIEVFSEQQIRLLLMNVDQPPPEGPGEQRLTIELSGERTIDLQLRFSSPRPTLHVVYHDPTFKEVESLLREVTEQDTPATRSYRETTRQETGAGTTAWQHLLSTAGRLWSRSTDWNSWLRPGAVTALFAVLLIVAFLIVRTRVTAPTVSAAELLSRSATAEETAASNVDQALHRTITLEERKVTGEVINRRRIEIWHSGGRGVTARRLYDERGALIAGDWRRSGGGQTIYHHGAQPQIKPLPDGRDQTPVSFADAWQLSPSAKEFAALIGSPNEARVEEEATSYAISYVSDAAGDAPGLVKATLVIRRADLYPIEQTILVRQGRELREYRFTETRFERRPLDAVAPQMFEPDPELLGLPVNPAGRVVEKSRAAVALAPEPTTPALLAATADLEVEALRLLNGVGADLGEQVSISRTPEGALKIQGIIETDKRKAEILSALAPIANHPAVRIEIRTVAESLAEQRRSRASSGPEQVQRVETASDIFPAYSDLRGRFTDEEARAFAARTVSRSHQSMRHVWALKRLVNQFSSEDLRTMSPEARDKWLALIRSHASAFGRVIASLRQDLHSTFSPASAINRESGGPEITNDADLVRAVHNLVDLATASDQMIRSAFSISTSDSGTAAIKSPQFWRSMESSEALAARIRSAK